MCKVSVIIPIYNVEQYLRKCLDSVVNQTLEDIELILVNDASPDASDVIMREYAAKYENIKCLFLEKNRCLGGARNAGVEVASGEFITFLDSDDYLDLDYCECMYRRLTETGSDFAYSAYRSVDEAGNVKSVRCAYPVEFDGILTEGKKNGIINKGVFAWGKMFRRDLWNRIGLEFPEHLKYEDAPTIPIYLLHATRICFVGDSFYNYLIRATSIVRTRNTGHQDAQETALLFRTRMEKYGFAEQYKDALEFFMVQRYYCIFLKRCVQMYDEIPYETMRQTRDLVREWYPNYENNPYFYTLVAEDRFRMKMNDISPQTCAAWESGMKKRMDEDDLIYVSMYKDFYSLNRERLLRMLEKTGKILLWGDRRKVRAMTQLLSEMQCGSEVVIAASKEELNEYVSCGGHLLIGVNPSACFDLHREKQQRGWDVKICNLEDTLHGYLEE